VQELLLAAEAAATEVLRHHRAEIERLIRGLEEEEDIERARIEQLLGARETATPRAVREQA
jgi:ATP-dependent Zn protease